LYASNRGDANSITIFSVAANGKLQWKGYESSMGLTPRNFTIDPTGNYLLVAKQNTNNIVIFKRDLKTGLLRYTGKQIDVPNPVCLQMMKQ
jgi:6-phosphogluconolactonase